MRSGLLRSPLYNNEYVHLKWEFIAHKKVAIEIIQNNFDF